MSMRLIEKAIFFSKKSLRKVIQRTINSLELLLTALSPFQLRVTRGGYSTMTSVPLLLVQGPWDGFWVESQRTLTVRDVEAGICVVVLAKRSKILPSKVKAIHRQKSFGFY